MSPAEYVQVVEWEFQTNEDEYYQEKQCGVCVWFQSFSVIFDLLTFKNRGLALSDYTGRRVSDSDHVSLESKTRARINGSDVLEQIWVENDLLYIDRDGNPSNWKIIQLSNVVHVLRSPKYEPPSIVALYVKDADQGMTVFHLEFECPYEMEAICSSVKKKLNAMSYFQMFVHQTDEDGNSCSSEL